MTLTQNPKEMRHHRTRQPGDDSRSSSDLPREAAVPYDLSENLIPERQTHDLDFAVVHELEDQPTIRVFAYDLTIIISQLP